MPDLSYIDIKTRTQYLSQYIADYGYAISTGIYGGKYCEKDFRKLSLLTIYADILICNLPKPEVIAIGQIEVDNFVIGSTKTLTSITINGVEIMGGVAGGGSSVLLAEDIAENINDHSSSTDYIATSDGNFVTIYGAVGTGSSANGTIVIVNGTGSATVISEVVGGEDEGSLDDVCLTNDELEGIFTHISELTGLCYVPAGSNYIDEPIESRVLDTLTTDTGDIIVTSDGTAISGG